jgi:acetyl-CoA C-acetyltransferase
VAVIGFQKMSEISSAESQERMGRGADIQWESPFGTMMPAYYAMYAQAHMETYGTTEEDLARSGSRPPPTASSTTGRSTANR